MRSHDVQGRARRRHPLETFAAFLSSRRPVRVTRQHMAGNRAMVYAFGLLERLERRRVIALPFDPPCQSGDGFIIVRGDEIGAISIARLRTDRVGHGATVTPA